MIGKKKKHRKIVGIGVWMDSRKSTGILFGTHLRNHPVCSNTVIYCNSVIPLIKPLTRRPTKLGPTRRLVTLLFSVLVGSASETSTVQIVSLSIIMINNPMR